MQIYALFIKYAIPVYAFFINSGDFVRLIGILCYFLLMCNYIFIEFDISLVALYGIYSTYRTKPFKYSPSG